MSFRDSLSKFREEYSSVKKVFDKYSEFIEKQIDNDPNVVLEIQAKKKLDCRVDKKGFFDRRFRKTNSVLIYEGYIEQAELFLKNPANYSNDLARKNKLQKSQNDVDSKQSFLSGILQKILKISKKNEKEKVL
jgi:hypothetical protein